mmetsp:Transcript_6256/g.9740  ORF Transcript_6256/g.9740 Transcript_6256/m.9740 type:complete len:107 (-) Transcript_6256:253-573(-)
MDHMIFSLTYKQQSPQILQFYPILHSKFLKEEEEKRTANEIPGATYFFSVMDDIQNSTVFSVGFVQCIRRTRLLLFFPVHSPQTGYADSHRFKHTDFTRQVIHTTR